MAHMGEGFLQHFACDAAIADAVHCSFQLVLWERRQGLVGCELDKALPRLLGRPGKALAVRILRRASQTGVCGEGICWLHAMAWPIGVAVRRGDRSQLWPPLEPSGDGGCKVAVFAVALAAKHRWAVGGVVALSPLGVPLESQHTLEMCYLSWVVPFELSKWQMQW